MGVRSCMQNAENNISVTLERSCKEVFHQPQSLLATVWLYYVTEKVPLLNLSTHQDSEIPFKSRENVPSSSLPADWRLRSGHLFWSYFRKFEGKIHPFRPAFVSWRVVFPVPQCPSSAVIEPCWGAYFFTSHVGWELFLRLLLLANVTAKLHSSCCVCFAAAQRSDVNYRE